MANYWKRLWLRLSGHDAKAKSEVERITALQQAAAERRAEYAQEQQRDAPSSASRQQMEAAESAHIAALQAWENKQSRQKSR